MTTPNPTNLATLLLWLAEQIHALEGKIAAAGISSEEVGRIADEKIQTAVAALKGSAPEALDTLAEIAAELAEKNTAAAAILSDLGEIKRRMAAVESFIGDPEALLTQMKAALRAD